MKFSILGTGTMGTAIGEAILNAGHDLIVYNRTMDRTKSLVEKGAIAVVSPAEAIAGSDITFIITADGKSALKVLNDSDVLLALKGKKIINAATSSVEDTLKINDIVIKNGGFFTEMAIDAIPETIRTTTGRVKIGCKSEDESSLVEILSSFIGEIVRVGNIGDVSKIELINLLGNTFSIIKNAYVIALAEKYQISSEIITESIISSDPMAEFYLPSMIAHNYDTMFGTIKGQIDVMTSLISGVGNQGISTKLLEEVLNLYKKTDEIGYSNKDIFAVLEALVNGNKEQ